MLCSRGQKTKNITKIELDTIVLIFVISFFMQLLAYHGKVCRTMRTAIRSNLFKNFHSFSAIELNNIGSDDEVFVWEFSGKQSNYGDNDDEDIKQLYI